VTAPPVTACPRSPTGQHLPTVVERDGDYRRECVYCKEEL